jgi:hypothetical protein
VGFAQKIKKKKERKKEEDFFHSNLASMLMQ